MHCVTHREQVFFIARAGHYADPYHFILSNLVESAQPRLHRKIGSHPMGSRVYVSLYLWLVALDNEEATAQLLKRWITINIAAHVRSPFHMEIFDLIYYHTSIALITL
jgi:hypothetical protein